MSVNNIPNATGIIPHYGPGQILVLPPNPNHPQGMTFFVPNLQTLAPATPQRVIPQATIQPQHQSSPASLDVVRKPRDLDKTNARIRNFKEKCLSHFIEGQLILETSKPLNELKTKSVKKRDRKKHSTQNDKQRQLLIHDRLSPPGKTIKTEQSQQTPAVSTGPVIDGRNNDQPPEIRLDDDIRRIRAEMPKWSVSDVAMFIERHNDIKQYSSKFVDDEVDGKALLLMIDRNLNLQWLASMFKHGPAMKIEAILTKYKVNE